MDWIEKNSKVIIFISPIIFSFIYGMNALFTDNAIQQFLHPVFNPLLSLLLSALFGVTISITGAAIFFQSKDIHKKILVGYKETINEKLGDIPADDYLQKIYGPLPPLFIRFLSKEREYLNTGFKQVTYDKTWPISTARSYESIIEIMGDAERVNIIDQDIERWFELLGAPENKNQHNTSTTFNYSYMIVADLIDKIKNIGIVDYRRIFILGDKYSGNLENDLLKENNSWDNLCTSTQLIIMLWELEGRLLRKRLKMKLPNIEKFGSRVIQARKISPDLMKNIKIIKDLVVFNKEICFQENLLFNENKPSDETRSQIIYDFDFVNLSVDTFNQTWDCPSLKKSTDFDISTYEVSIPYRISVG